ncbi:unnamed protein product [Urochloa humidicola]
MGHTRSLLSATARAVHKIDGLSRAYDATRNSKSTWNFDGCKWEVHLYPWHSDGSTSHVALKIIFLGDGSLNKWTANLSCRLLDPTGSRPPSEEKVSAPASFDHNGSEVTFWFMRWDEVCKSGYLLNDDSLTIECAINVSKDAAAMTIPVPSSNLPQHLGELLESQVGANVTFTVSGESFAAHKNVLAARSPVFMAELFGEMQEKSSKRIKIGEMEPSVFRAMLRFIYTDAVPELDKKIDEATATLAQHLVVAADRYGLDRLKVMCEHSLAYAIDVSTVATTLALAERHGCSQLKAKCVEFIAGGSGENLDAVMQTEGFKDLMSNSPTLLAELLVAANGKKN